ncbi:PHP domain-containing protein [Schaalia sp. 19OD2882]|uniref:PHP domain-containing protein n=1 Tax=Schaalia sp. 19OD2882 TaxID=2794089 RepID=UPI001C1ED44C|nr:PHP domain-containing protein [Schaalia sp. 19OD2882]QWW20078.1 PHP domain-containing protein [Schaalia sp. 19OD2882]
MIRIDPHTHTSCSDGTDSPAQLMEAARRAGLDVIGLTDHDTFAGWGQAAARTEGTGVALLRGVEMSCSAEGITVHLLGYLPDPTDSGLLNVFAESRESRLTRARRMVDNLAADYPITWEQVQAFAPDDGPVGRPHIADALVAAGAFPDRSAAFTRALHPSGPYYVHHWAPDPVEAVGLVIAAGGVPVLAHPRARARQRLLPVDVIDRMAEAGLFGIERDHRDHGPQDRAEVQAIAERLNLRMTGSSDYHGTGKPNRLGENLTPESVLREIEERGALEVLRP